jgi:hypothetical protein
MAVFRSALDNHILSNSKRYQFCLSPTCPGIYENVEGATQATCCTRLLEICTVCVASHEGLSCKDYKLASVPLDRMREKIVDDIMTLRCPRCSQAFVDFDGCFALYCSLCPCRFCGWCLKDCGDHDAHPHVKTCEFKEPGSDTYHGTFDMFKVAQNKKRRTNLLNLLDTLSSNERKTTLKAIEKDLEDLELVL